MSAIGFRGGVLLLLGALAQVKFFTSIRFRIIISIKLSIVIVAKFSIIIIIVVKFSITIIGLIRNLKIISSTPLF